jgi:hypothetical protein
MQYDTSLKKDVEKYLKMLLMMQQAVVMLEAEQVVMLVVMLVVVMEAKHLMEEKQRVKVVI